MKRTSLFVLVILALAMMLGACGAAATPAAPAPTTASGGETAQETEPTAAPAEEATEAPAEEATEAPAEAEATPTPGILIAGEATMPDRTPVRWYVGLGAGSDQPLLIAQQELVDEFNASQEEIELILEVVDNDVAYDVLNTQIAAGNAPDVVGPLGVRGRASFPGAWLDMTPLIEASDYDLSDFDPALVDFWKSEEGQVGLPFAVFPSFVYYNKTLFDEAGLAYPPTAYGEPYIDADGNEKEWSFETVRELGLLLTVDANGNDATSPDFDPDNIVQFGYGTQFTDLRGRNALFGAGNLIDEEGNAAYPDTWREATQWYHDAMWVDHFYPNDAYGSSDAMGGGNWFSSGNIGMAHIHLWFTGFGFAEFEDDWGIAPTPSHNGVTTAKLHADTFGILKAGKQNEAAFTVVQWFLGEKAADMSAMYGGMPARQSLQEEFLSGLQEQFSDQDVAWNIVTESLSYPDIPSHEEGLPSLLEATDRYTVFAQLLDSNADVDIEAEIETLLADLQAIYDAAE
jgi:multiple sugar transport system substrate-binding protein